MMFGRILSAITFMMGAAPVFAQPTFSQPKTYPPDAATLKKIQEQTETLRAAIGAIKSATPTAGKPDVEIYLKAAEWIVRHGEWYTEKSGQQTLDVLTAGLARAKALADGKAPWMDLRGKATPLAYVSVVDGSVQPYSLLFPANYDPKKSYRLDVVLHGRDGTLTEVKFLASREAAKGGNPPDHFVLEIYGRGNNAYRWAGESDIFEALRDAIDRTRSLPGGDSTIDKSRIVLRGFSMGGAGTWHIGLHHPTIFAAISPGAGFSTTRGYIGKFPTQPEYTEKCLHIYDAIDYAENAFLVPVVAYSGEKDPQKAAADNIEKALANFTEPHSFTHLVAPGLQHQQPAEWLKKCDAEIRKHIDKKAETPERVRFVTYTTQYNRAAWIEIAGLDRHYEKAVVDGTWNADGITLATANIRRLILSHSTRAIPETITLDGQLVKTGTDDHHEAMFEKSDGKWQSKPIAALAKLIEKKSGVQGPIDDAFRQAFTIVAPTGTALNADVGVAAQARHQQFVSLWDRYLRGKLTSIPADKVKNINGDDNLVLFGDPGSNPVIARLLPRLPITWTAETLEVNGVKYDPKTHFPVLIYPNPENPQRYIVINSGHTFGEADFRGTNALLYPRLGDWAVLKVAATIENPAAVEVAAAGLFDEKWQYAGKQPR